MTLMIQSWCPGQKCDPCKTQKLQISGSASGDPAYPGLYLYFYPNPWTGAADYTASATITVKDYYGVIATPDIKVTGTTFLRYVGGTAITVPLPLTGLNCPNNFDLNSPHVFMHVTGTNSPYYAGGLQVFENGISDPYFRLTII